jgi:hypothetical protein
MKRTIPLAAVVLLVGLAQAVAGEQTGKGRAALEQNLIGVWQGRTTCDGRLVFRADGSYELREYGPAHEQRQGTWKVRGEALPATLVLLCKTADVEEEIGKTTTVKLIEVNDKNLTITYANPNDSSLGCYTRGGGALKNGRRD